MLVKLLEIWKKWSDEGMKLPFVFDSRTKKPSITLLFAYVTFINMIISLILLHVWQSLLIATSASILVWVIAVIFYRLRNLDKAKIDLDDKSIELQGGSDNEEEDK